jgi:hypothetical protein
MIGLPVEAEELLWGDDAILRELEDARKAFESGDRSALTVAVFYCARFQAVIPEWAADALLEIQEKLESGELQDCNEAFGWKSEYPDKRCKMHRQNKHAKAVLSRLLAYRLEGGTLNVEQAFQPVADDLQISRRDVEAIYKREGQFIKELPRGGDGGNHGVWRSTLPTPRRHGRPLLRDPKR